MKNRSALTFLLSSNIVSGFAQGISVLAVPWYFADILDQSSLFAVVYGLVTFLSLFWSLYAGTLIDRYSRKSLFLYANLIAGSLVALAAIYGFAYGAMPSWMILSVFGMTSLFFNIHYPALYAFGQEITDPKDYGRINSLFEIQNQATKVFSGATAAVLISGTVAYEAINVLGLNVELPFAIEAWGLHAIFAFDALTYFVAMVLISRIKYTPAEKKKVDRGRVLDRLQAGFRYFRKHPLVFKYGLFTHSLFAFVLVQILVVLPQYVNQWMSSGPDLFASGQAYYAVGALTAGFAIRRIFSRTNNIASVIILMLLAGSVFVYLSLGQVTLLFYTCLFLTGITNAGTRIIRVTFLFNQIPNHVIGRTNSVFTVINLIVRSVLIGVFSLPYFMGGPTVRYAYLFGGLFVAASAIPLLIDYKNLRALSVDSSGV